MTAKILQFPGVGKTGKQVADTRLRESIEKINELMREMRRDIQHMEQEKK